jgi:hypothetical protein
MYDTPQDKYSLPNQLTAALTHKARSYRVSEGYKAESTRPICLPVKHNHRVQHFSKLFKKLAKLAFNHLIGITEKQANKSMMMRSQNILQLDLGMGSDFAYRPLEVLLQRASGNLSLLEGSSLQWDGQDLLPHEVSSGLLLKSLGLILVEGSRNRLSISAAAQ